MNLELFGHNHVNLTGLRLVDREHSSVQSQLNRMKMYQTNTGLHLVNNTDTGVIKVSLTTSMG